MEQIHNLKWEKLQNLFDTISWFLVKSPGFLPEISWFSKFWSGMSAYTTFLLNPECFQDATSFDQFGDYKLYAIM